LLYIFATRICDAILDNPDSQDKKNRVIHFRASCFVIGAAQLLGDGRERERDECFCLSASWRNAAG